MTSPIGKILLAKLPKDIVQFCIEPMLMISKEEVHKNYQNLVHKFQKYTPQVYNMYSTRFYSVYYFDIVLVAILNYFWATDPDSSVPGDSIWRQRLFSHEREVRNEQRWEKWTTRLEAWQERIGKYTMWKICYFVFLCRVLLSWF